ncbi:calcineurin-like phosphoesterase family protein [Echinicola sp. CAU 1574]|uniref:Calcineurin-like phosphoesterase family protein n=1 Tax=Echinicola arenosa TaxID=2774144 RepID=A0ABR9ATU8_9BACT|nr:calcineurin-like phosphoesterase family protein [Echinicola arenosa]MBD8491029.1 calcineurin-like phosphoesterase family protein [Echinicola arenosa]
MKKLLLSGLLLATAWTAMAQETAKGTVYEDLNGNGKKEGREKGIAQVAVSNGVEVTLTDEKGRYELPVTDDQIIFVIKPSGYQVPVNDKNLPQYFYIHKPAGSPETEFAGVAPTGKLPKKVDFGLIPLADKSNFTALIFGDPQPYTIEEVNHFDNGVVSEVTGIEGIDFGLSLGDLVGNDLSLFKPYIDATAKVGVPWYNVLGNHDLNFDVKEDHLADETFEAHFGPANYAFNHGKVHFIVLDDILYPDPRDGKSYWGGFRDDQLTFVKNDLKHVPNDHLIVLAFHIPLSEPDGDPFVDEDREQLFELLSDFPYTLSLSAHTHLQKQDFFFEKDGWNQNHPHHHYNVGTTSGDWYSGTLNEKGIPKSTMRDGTPKGYAFIDFTGNQYEIRYKVVDQAEDYQMEIFAPKVLEKDKRTSAGIFVNFFMGTSEDQVRYRIDNGPWKEMTYLEEYDPSYMLDVYQWDTTEQLLDGRRPSNPVKSTHLWRAGINAKEEKGVHTIEVEATDMFGKKHYGKKTYHIK